MTAYYKTNNKVLEFNITKDLDLIIFNHYLSQKENFERLKGSLKKGYLGISLRTVAEDLKISTTKVRKLIDRFIKLGIIELISKSDKKGIPSIYAITTVANEEKKSPYLNNKINNEINYNLNTNKISNYNSFNEIENNKKDTNKNTKLNTTKKELLKISCSCCSNEEQNELEDERVALVKSYGFNISNAQEKLIQKLDRDRLLNAIELSVAQEGKSFSYIYKVYLNNKKAPTTAIVDALSSNAQSSTKNNVKKSISNRKRKDKSIYMCKTMVEFEGKLVDTEDLNEDEFERLIKEKQKLKWG